VAIITADEWSEAQSKITSWTQAQPAYTSYYEVHQRIQLYIQTRQDGHTHEGALAVAMDPEAKLPNLTFTAVR
jgi:hypothetical protein